MDACFPCLGVRKRPPPPVEATPGHPQPQHHNVAALTFSFLELAAATRHFTDRRCLVAGNKAGLYKGYLERVNQVVALKLLPRHAAADGSGSSEQGNHEFLAHVLKLSALRHPNLVNFVGFCADGDHRILVHEYMPLGSLEDHLHDPSPDKARLDWNTRMNIASGVAKGLMYLHDQGMVYRCMRSSDILLGDADGYYYPKLSQYGLTELGQHDLDEHITKVSAFTGTLAPETAMTGRLSAASDVYTFGVVLLEIITGRRTFDTQATGKDRSLLAWAAPLMKDRKEFCRMADPALQGRYPSMDLEEALAVASMCIHETPAMRSPMSAVVAALARLAYDHPAEPHHTANN